MRAGRSLTVVGAVLLLLSSVLGGVAAAQLVGRAVRTATEVARQPVRTPPFSAPVQLDEGTWAVYVGTGCRPGRTCPAGVAAPEVTVTGPDGAAVPIRDQGGETITRGSRAYRAAVGFEVDRAGAYVVEVPAGEEFLLAPALTAAVRGALGWVLAALAAVLVLVLGIVLLLAGLVLWTRERRVARASGPRVTGPEPPARAGPT
jgi:hypothetical protein